MTRALRPMPRRIPALLAAALILAASPLADAPAEAAVTRSAVVTCPGGGDCWPAAFDFTPSGRVIYYVERFTGRIRTFSRTTGRTRTFHTIGNLETSGERGSLGLALDPRWPHPKWVYVFSSKTNGTNRIFRYRTRNGRLISERIFSYGSNSNHNGGTIGFNSHGQLFVVTGDLGDKQNSQRRRSPAGKVLRMTKRGKRPGTNPFARSLAWSIGHRNSYGFDFDPQTGRLWQTENGPECEDELNRIVRRGNYGWGPGSDCPGTSTEGPDPIGPRRSFTPVPALTGAAFCAGCGLAGTEGDLVFGAWNDGRIRRAELNAERTGIVDVDLLFDHPRGVLSVEASPAGRIFFSDSRGIYRLNES